MRTNAPILSASNLEAMFLNPLTQESLQKIVEGIFPEIRDISRASQPEVRAFHVQRLERRLLSGGSGSVGAWSA